jgi:hypothetical protein
MPQENVEIVRGGYDAYNRNGFESVRLRLAGLRE